MLVNGEPVGIAKDSRTPAEFDVSELVRHDGPNELVAVVVRWSDASFVEDQDQWWHGGHLRARSASSSPTRRATSSVACRRPTARLSRSTRRADGDVPRCSTARGPRRRDAARSRRPARRRGALAAALVGGGARAVHARARPTAARRVSMPRRLPHRRDPRPAAARQRRAGADRGVNRHDHDDTRGRARHARS